MSVPRTRTQGSITGLPYNDVITTQCGTGSSSSGTISNLTGETKTFSDWVTPNFKSRSRRGEIIVNPMITHITRRGCTETGYKWKCLCDTNKYTTYDFQGPYLSRSWVGGVVQATDILSEFERNAVRSEAVTAARADLFSPNAQLMVDAAEAGKTLQMLRNPLDNLNQLFRKINNRRLSSRASRALSFTQFLGNEWLRYRYGILPLVSTIDGIVQSIDERKVVEATRQTSRATRQTSTSTHSVSQITSNGVVIQFGTYRESSYKCRAGLIYEDFVTMEQKLGIDWREIPSAAWDLVPYSFVVDHFFNINDFIRGFWSTVGRQSIGEWYTEEYRDIISRAIGYCTPASSGLCGGYSMLTAPAGTAFHEVIRRYRVPSLPNSSITPRLSLVSDGVKAKRILDYFSLTVQRLR